METKELVPGEGKEAHPSGADTSQSPPAPGPDDELRGAHVGRYVLLKKLGEGGMGVVYAAYDPDLDRKVALKLLHSKGREDSELARARLLREAQAMARISHPNVLPIFELGVWGSQVFLSMELVEGGTLGSWMQEKPRPWREVLDKFLHAGRGLQAAHAAGLVHRDFKPANVLLGRDGSVRVTDFGLARQVGHSGRDADFLPQEALEHLSPDSRMLEAHITQQGLVMGTPNYMSPEQFRAEELDARSDQFSFCVALYWGLYGQRAFEPTQMRALVRQQLLDALASPPPSRVEPTASMGMEPRTPALEMPALVPVPGRAAPAERLIREPPREAKVPTWVRNALMRGLELEAGARFASMGALLEALSQEQRLSKRRKWGAGLATAAVGLSLVGGVAYQHTQVCADAAAAMDGTWNAQVRQQVEEAFAATRLPLARDMAQRVTRTLGAYAEAWSAQSIASCEATRRRGAQPEELFARRVGCLERRRQDLHALVGLLSQADPKLVERSLDAALTLPALSECADAEALSLQQRLPEDPTRRAEIARLSERLSEVRALLVAGRTQSAAEKAQPLVAPVEATGHLPLLAELHYDLGTVQLQQEHMPEAARLLSRSVYDAAAGGADRTMVYNLIRLLFAEGEQKHFEREEGWAALAEALLVRVGDDPVMRGDLLTNHSTVLTMQRRYPEALTLLQEARALRERSLPPGNPQRAQGSYLLGCLLLEMRKPEEAVEPLRSALTQTEAAMGPLHPDMMRRHLMLATALRKSGQFGPALEHARAAARVAESAFGKDSYQLANMLQEVGLGLSNLGRHTEALEVYHQALALRHRAPEPDSGDLSSSLSGVGQELLKMGRPQEAIPLLRQALACENVEPRDLASSNFVLAQALRQTGQPGEARAVAALARQQYQTEKMAPEVAEVDAWLKTLPGAH